MKTEINYDNESHQLNYRPYSNYWPYSWRCWTSLLEVHQLPEARRYGFDTSAFLRLVRGWDTFRPLSQGTELGKVIGGVERDVCGVFGMWAGAMDSCIGQREGVDRRAQRKWLQSTYRRGSSNSSDSTVCEVIDL